MNTTNIKDTLATICGWVLGIAGAILGLTTSGVTLPPIVLTITAGAAAVAGVVLGILTGKNPNGSTKVIDPATGQAIIPPAASATDVPAK